MDVAILNCKFTSRSFPFGFFDQCRIYIDLIYYKLPAKVRPWIMRQMKVGSEEKRKEITEAFAVRIAQRSSIVEGQKKNHLQIVCVLCGILLTKKKTNHFLCQMNFVFEFSRLRNLMLIFKHCETPFSLELLLCSQRYKMRKAEDDFS